MARQFRAVGHEIVTSAQMADMAVVNTCAVTNEAAADSRGKIRHIARAGVNEIIATGCLQEWWLSFGPFRNSRREHSEFIHSANQASAGSKRGQSVPSNSERFSPAKNC